MISFFLALFISFQLFLNRGGYKSLLWGMIGLIVINKKILVQIPTVMHFHLWICFSFLMLALYYFPRFKKNLKYFPLKKTLLFLMLCSFTVGILDPRLTIWHKIRFPLFEIVGTYLPIFLGYFCINSIYDINKLIKPIAITMIFVGLYGVFNYVTKSNPYYSWVIASFFSGGEMDLESAMRVLDGESTRYRAVSTFDSPFNYGYVSALFALFFSYCLSLKKYNRIGKKVLNVSLALSIIGVFICFSRTVLSALIISYLVYFLFSTLSTKLKYTFITIIFLGFTYATVPAVQKASTNLVEVFTKGGKDLGGSSIEMRSLQFFGALKYFEQSPIRGNGYAYIARELGWADRDGGSLDEDMYGFESIIYKLMIEQGIIGISGIVIFFVAIFRFLLRKKKVDKQLSILGVSIATLFLAFSIGTGSLGAWPFTMLLLGVIIKTIQLKEITKKIYEI